MMRKLKVTTVRSLQAAAAVGFTHWGAGPFTGFDWCVDDLGFYHAARRQTPRGGEPRVMHACRWVRNRMTAELGRLKLVADLHGDAMPSREYTRVELGLVCPSWVCDHDSDWTACADTLSAIAPLCLGVEHDDRLTLVSAVK